MKIQRHTWENAVITAEAVRALDKGAVNFCLRIARAVNWTPREGKRLGLNWDNPTAFTTVGTSKSTYYLYKKRLEGLGLLTVVGGNIVPTLPPDLDEWDKDYKAYVDDVQEKHKQDREERRALDRKRYEEKKDSTPNLGPEDQDSTPNLGLSVPKLGLSAPSLGLFHSQSRTPLSEDRLSEDTCSEDACSEETFPSEAAPRYHSDSEEPVIENLQDPDLPLSEQELDDDLPLSGQDSEGSYDGEDGLRSQTRNGKLSYEDLARTGGFVESFFTHHRQLGYSEKTAYEKAKNYHERTSR